jgi:RecA/RadA recombinase
MPVDPSKIGEVLAAIEKKYGSEAVGSGVNYAGIPRIPTGSLELDWATGGGIPVGRWTRLWGGYSSGKSLTCWNTIREAQKLGLTCVYYNAEKQFDPDFTRDMGVDLDKLIIIHGSVIETLGAELEALLSVAHVHVIDSESQCVSLEEMNSNVADWHMGLNARVWSKVIRRTAEKFDEHHNVGIIVSQARDSFGYGGGETPPGGRLMEHNSSLTIYFKRGSWLFYDENGVLKDKGKGSDTLSGKAEADGVEYVARVNKSRVCRPLRTAAMRYDFKKRQFDQAFEYTKAAVFTGYVNQTSAGRFELEDGTKIHGAEKLRPHLDSDEHRAGIRDRLMKLAR